MKIWLIGVLLSMDVINIGVYDNIYTLQNCIVTKVCEQSALIQDYNGNLWEVQDVNLWEHQVVDLVMDNNGTTIIKDDIVKRVN